MVITPCDIYSNSYFVFYFTFVLFTSHDFLNLSYFLLLPLFFVVLVGFIFSLQLARD
jgi:hypothetical protein